LHAGCVRSQEGGTVGSGEVALPELRVEASYCEFALAAFKKRSGDAGQAGSNVLRVRTRSLVSTAVCQTGCEKVSYKVIRRTLTGPER
jgi:hypothetical protein